MIERRQSGGPLRSDHNACNDCREDQGGASTTSTARAPTLGQGQLCIKDWPRVGGQYRIAIIRCVLLRSVQVRHQGLDCIFGSYQWPQTYVACDERYTVSSTHQNDNRLSTTRA
jgi:hypothetical protein